MDLEGAGLVYNTFNILIKKFGRIEHFHDAFNFVFGCYIT